jgi:sugar/nucleoside kinase (ribokinase family)
MDADILHIGYILLLDGLDAPDDAYPTAMCRVLDEARAHGIATSVDVVSEEGDRYARLVPPALRYTDYCIINEIEAGRTTGIPLRDGESLIEENLESCVRALADMGVARWAVVHMPELSVGYDAERDVYCREDSWKVPAEAIVSSVGAGDAFACGILYGAYNDWDILRALRMAGAVAAHSLSGFGASDAMIPIDDVLRRMESYR